MDVWIFMSLNINLLVQDQKAFYIRRTTLRRLQRRLRSDYNIQHDTREVLDF